MQSPSDRNTMKQLGEDWRNVKSVTSVRRSKRSTSVKARDPAEMEGGEKAEKLSTEKGGDSDDLFNQKEYMVKKETK